LDDVEASKVGSRSFGLITEIHAEDLHSKKKGTSNPVSFLNKAVCAFFAEKHKVAVSVNDFVVRAVAVALQRVPEANGELKNWV
jgi:pyruvate/2-oxoglutarate dehydrogenase complex dihydrolipoamide acyltransferase (E2) component